MGKSTETLSAYGSFCNRVDEILQRYAEKNSFTYIKNGGNRESYTFYDVAEFLKLAGDEFKRIGLLRGDRVAIVSPHSPFAVFVGMALAYYGVTIALIDASLPYEEIAHLISYSDVKAIFTTTALHKNLNQRIDEKLPCFSLDYGLRISSFNTAHEKYVKLGVSEDLDEDVIAILYSSGTTGQMKGVMVTYESVLKAHEVFVRLSGLEDFMTYMLALPFNHIAGFTGAMTFFLTGCEIGFIEDVNATKLQAGLLNFQPYYFAMVPKVFEVMEQKIRAVIHAKGKMAETSMNMLFRISGFFRKRLGINLGKKLFHGLTSQVFGENIFGIGTGASPCKKETAEFFLNLGLEWANLYATTETSVPIVATGVLDKYPADTVGNVNHHPEIEVKIREADPNGIGEIMVKSQLMMKGYFKRPDMTAAAFENGFFKTGDYGYIDKKGNLHITGRMKESIVLQNGKKVSPSDVDDYYAVRIPNCDIASRGIPAQNETYDEICMFVATKGITASEQETLRMSLEQSSRQAPDMYKLSSVYFIPEIPRTSVGKVKRYCLNKEAAQEISKAAQTDIFTGNRLIAIIQKHCDVPIVTMDSNLRDDLGLDSLSMFEIVCQIETEFRADISTELNHVFTVDDMVRAVNEASPTTKFRNKGNKSVPFDVKKYPAKKGSFHRLLFCFFVGLSRMLWNFEIIGVENIPRDRNYIVCPNHESHLDGLWVWTAMGTHRPDYANICCMAKKEHLESATARMWMKMLGGIPVDRFGNSTVSMVRCCECIKMGYSLLLHPEGTRTRDGKTGEFKQGAAKLAEETGKELLPVYIQGAYEIYPYHQKLPSVWDKKRRCRYTLRISFGIPISPENKSVQELTNELKESIERMKQA